MNAISTLLITGFALGFMWLWVFHLDRSWIGGSILAIPATMLAAALTGPAVAVVSFVSFVGVTRWMIANFGAHGILGIAAMIALPLMAVTLGAVLAGLLLVAVAAAGVGIIARAAAI